MNLYQITQHISKNVITRLFYETPSGQFKAWTFLSACIWLGREVGHPTSPPLEPHRALLRQWAHDKTIHSVDIQPSYSSQFCFRYYRESDVLTTFLLKESLYLESFPLQELPCFTGTMTHLTSWPSFRLPRFYTCQPILSFRKEQSGYPTFTYLLSLHAVLSDPGGVIYLCHISRYIIVLSELTTSSATPEDRINGAQSLQPYGLRPITSLSTLNSCRYQHRPKTRYRICLVNTFPVALSATSK